jgi:hypothetical protein
MIRVGWMGMISEENPGAGGGWSLSASASPRVSTHRANAGNSRVGDGTHANCTPILECEELRSDGCC